MFKVQKKQITIPDGSTSLVDDDLNSFNTEASLLFFSAHGAGSGDQVSHLQAVGSFALTGTDTEIDWTRNGSSGDLVIERYLVEALDGEWTVQNRTGTISGTAVANVGITAVTLARAFLNAAYRGQGARAEDTAVACYFQTSSNVQAVAGTSIAAPGLTYFIQACQIATTENPVCEQDLTVACQANTDVDVADEGTTNTFCIGTGSYDSGAQTNPATFRIALASGGGTVEIRRDSTVQTGENTNIITHQVSFDSITTVHGTITIPDGATSADSSTLATPTDAAGCVVIMGALFNQHQTTADSGNVQSGHASLSLNGAGTVVTATRVNTTGALVVPFTRIEFPVEASGGTATANFTAPSAVFAATADAEVDATAAFAAPAAVFAAEADAELDAAAAFTAPAAIFAAAAAAEIDAAANFTAPSAIFAASASVGNNVTAAFTAPAAVFAATADVEVNVAASFGAPAAIFAAAADAEVNATAAFSAPSAVFAAEADVETLPGNAAAAAFVAPSAQFSASASAEVDVAAAFGAPSAVFAAAAATEVDAALNCTAPAAVFSATALQDGIATAVFSAPSAVFSASAIVAQTTLNATIINTAAPRQRIFTAPARTKTFAP